MRTSFDLPDEVWEEYKIWLAKNGISMAEHITGFISKELGRQKSALPRKVRSLADAQEVLGWLEDDERRAIWLHPDAGQGDLVVAFNAFGCREFWNGEEGNIGEDPRDVRAKLLYQYRAAYNAGRMKKDE